IGGGKERSEQQDRPRLYRLSRRCGGRGKGAGADRAVAEQGARRRQGGTGGVACRGRPQRRVAFLRRLCRAGRQESRRLYLFALRSEEHTSELQSLMRIS